MNWCWPEWIRTSQVFQPTCSPWGMAPWRKMQRTSWGGRSWRWWARSPPSSRSLRWGRKWCGSTLWRWRVASRSERLHRLCRL